MFDAIVLSNGWDDVTAALQLLSHLEGDSKRVLRVGLVGALSAHYGSPGFERTTRKSGEDPSIFATPGLTPRHGGR